MSDDYATIAQLDALTASVAANADAITALDGVVSVNANDADAAWLILCGAHPKNRSTAVAWCPPRGASLFGCAGPPSCSWAEMALPGFRFGFRNAGVGATSQSAPP